MAQKETYIAIVSESLSKPDDTRYIIIDRQTREVMDTCGGHGYKSAAAAHKSFAFKQRRRQRSQMATQMKQQYRSSAGASTNAQKGATAASSVTRVNSWSGYAPRRPQRRPQSVTQENTPPPPDLFGFRPEDR